MNKLSYHDASIATIVDKINELVTYVNKNGDSVKRPMVLYAVENIKTGAIIFNARGSGYQDKDAAIRKCKELGEGALKQSAEILVQDLKEMFGWNYRVVIGKQEKGAVFLTSMAIILLSSVVLLWVH